MTQKSQIKMQILPLKKIQILKNRLETYLIGPKWRFWKKKFWVISQKKFGSAYAQSPGKCSNIEILAKIEGKEAKFFSKIYEGHIRIWFRSKKNSKLSHACVPLSDINIVLCYVLLQYQINTFLIPHIIKLSAALERITFVFCAAISLPILEIFSHG